MSRRTILLASIAALLFLLAGAITLQLASRPVASRTVETHVQLADRVGINLDSDKLYFGTMRPGDKAARHINLTSPTDTYVVISKHGEMAEWLYPSKNGFLLGAGEVEDVLFTLKTPSEASEGNYTGRIILAFYRPFMGRLLG